MSYQSKQYRIKKLLPQTEDNIMFRIKTDINPMPGQFVEVSIPGIGEAPISSASYSKSILDLNVRVVGNVTEAMIRLKKGEKIYLRGPFGKGYPMKELEGKNLILVGGGCGVAPLRGLIEYLDAHRLAYKEVTLFFGYRTPDDILFKDEVDKWKGRYQLFMSIDKPAKENPFNCPVGFVTEILQKAELSTEESVVLMCGPPIMMTKTAEILARKGFSEDQIWVSLERHMKCSTGKCGHCMVNEKYVCIDGPVFRYDEVKNLDE